MLEWIAIIGAVLWNVPREERLDELRNQWKHRHDKGSPIPADRVVVRQLALTIAAIVSIVLWVTS